MMDTLAADSDKEMQEAEFEEKDAQGDYENIHQGRLREAHC